MYHIWVDKTFYKKQISFSVVIIKNQEVSLKTLIYKSSFLSFFFAQLLYLLKQFCFVNL
jgi:hypothetical protein